MTARLWLIRIATAITITALFVVVSSFTGLAGGGDGLGRGSGMRPLSELHLAHAQIAGNCTLVAEYYGYGLGHLTVEKCDGTNGHKMYRTTDNVGVTIFPSVTD